MSTDARTACTSSSVKSLTAPRVAPEKLAPSPARRGFLNEGSTGRNANMPTTIQLPAGTEWVTVRSIPKLFAIALHGEPPSGNEMTAADMVWHGAVIEVEETIKRAVMQDELMPRNALSRRPMPDVRGEALRDAIVTVADLAEFAAQFVVGVSVEAAQTGTTPALAKVGGGDTAKTEMHNVKYTPK